MAFLNILVRSVTQFVDMFLVAQESMFLSVTQLLPFELFSKKFCLNISELGFEIV